MNQLTPPVTLVSVEGKNITTARGPGIIYEVRASDGRTYSTFMQPLAQKASSLQGQVVTLSYQERQKGQYTNYQLEGVFGSNESPAAADTVPIGPVVSPVAQIPVAPPVNADLRDLKIQRQAAQRTAAIFVSGLYAGAGPDMLHEAVGNLRKLTADLLAHTASGEWAGGIVVPAEPAVPVPVLPVQAAAPQATGIEW